MASYVKHQYGFEYPIVPFLWNYTEFSNPFPSYSVTNFDKKSFMNIVNSTNVALNREFDLLTDNSTQFIIHAQYKGNEFLYEGDSNDIYLGYHTWCYFGKHNKVLLEDNHDMFFFNTGIFPLDGDLVNSEGYPNKGTYKQNKPGGIEINNGTTKRCAVIHKLQNITRFSSINVCNFKTHDENIAFVSIGKYFSDKTKTSIKVNGKSNVVVLHIFRNKADNDKENSDFVRLLEKYKCS